MSCLCLPKRHHDRNNHFFHWPNFTFSHSEHAINPRRIHSTFGLNNTPKPRYGHHRRHTLHNGTTVADLAKPKKSKRSFKSTKTAPAIVVNEMGDQYAPPPGLPPSYHDQQSTSHDRHRVHWPALGNGHRERASNNPSRSAHMTAPQGPPPSNLDAPPQYEPPSGPPPSWNEEHATQDVYAPPPGPPPNHSFRPDTNAQPSGARSSDMSNETEPPPYDPWLAVPDNALLPPPPSIREERSPAANASYDDAARAHEWCRQNPLRKPNLQKQGVSMRTREIQLLTPPHMQFPHPNHSRIIDRSGPGDTGPYVSTTAKCSDSIFLSSTPLYTPSFSNNETPRTIYYELKVLSMDNTKTEAGIAIGFLAPPYPSWRLPGWHRASIGVHSDDGRRYVDDSYGGRDFTKPFRKGDVVGIGMNFAPPPAYQRINASGGNKMDVKVFFTRNGKREGGWDVHEERDKEAEEGDVTGLEGEHDLLAAVGCFGPVEFEVHFKASEWLFKP